MENVLLKMHYMGKCVLVKVDDTDRCLLIDVINELYDEAEKHRVSLPTHPSLGYTYQMEYVPLNDDNNLLQMFSRCVEEKVIDIWIESTSCPSHVLTMARQVRANHNKGVEVGSLFDKYETLPSTTNASDNRIGVLPSDLALIPHASSSSANVTTQIQQSRQFQMPTKFKVPKATAKKRGVFIPKTRATSVPEKSFRMKTRGLRVEYDKSGDESGSDDSYLPYDEEFDEAVSDENLSDLEVEDELAISTLDYIDDGYVAYKEHEWTSGEDGYTVKLLHNGEVYENKEFGAIRLRPWMIFMDKDHFKDALRDFCIQEGFHIVVDKADNMRYTADCATIDCLWRIHASVLGDGITWAIKSIRNPNHDCVGVKTHNPMATAIWVAKKMIEDIRANHDISGASINKLLMERYGLELKKSTLYNMKELALREINGGHDESYNLLPSYCEVVKQTNPGSYAICAWSAMNSPEKMLQFKSIFVSFNAQFQGLIAGCRSLIGVDGTHLKGNHGGVLMSAIALDGNNELFPIAVSVVESESKETWSNFFWHLRHVLRECGRTNWTIISDRQKGIEPALDTIWPEASRRFCARHLSQNFKKEYPGILMHKLFWRVVNAYSEFSFKKALEMVVQNAGKGCARWFLNLGNKEHWCVHQFDPQISCEENTSNFVESFNSTLGVHRLNPVLSLLEGVRRLTMVRHATRQHVAESWSEDGICPNIRDRLRVLRKDAKTCQAYRSGKGEYEIHEGRSSLPVSLNNRTCLCGQWQISGIPCRHAIRAILSAEKDPADYVSDWFSVRRYKAAYGLSINPIPDKEQWSVFDVPVLQPPTLRRSIGRPSRNRKREHGEQRKGKRSATIKCKNCGCLGHNSKTCKGGYTAKERDEMQGKSRKRKTTKGPKELHDTSMFRSLDDLEGAIMSTTQMFEVTDVDCEAGTTKGKRRKVK